MHPPNRRSLLLEIILRCRRRGSEPDHWEFTTLDEAILFDFIHPAVNTREPNFRLFNLPIQWGATESALIEKSGTKTPFDLDQSHVGLPERELASAKGKGLIGAEALSRLRQVERCKECHDAGTIGIYSGGCDLGCPREKEALAHMGKCRDCLTKVIEELSALLSLPLRRMRIHGSGGPREDVSSDVITMLRESTPVCSACLPHSAVLPRRILAATAPPNPAPREIRRPCGHCGVDESPALAVRHAPQCVGCLEIVMEAAIAPSAVDVK